MKAERNISSHVRRTDHREKMRDKVRRRDREHATHAAHFASQLVVLDRRGKVTERFRVPANSGLSRSIWPAGKSANAGRMAPNPKGSRR